MPDRVAEIQITGLSKRFQAPQPLRIDSLVVQPRDRITLTGLDPAAAELLVNLVTGAALPDEGDVMVAGRNTRDIATDTEWLTSLDRFGIVTERAVLLEGLSIACNLALPLTLSIDPIPDDIRRQVDALADEVRLPRERLDSPVGPAAGYERLRIHLARALAMQPRLLLLEHPTARLDASEATAFGQLLASIAAAREIGFVAMTFDNRFASAAGGRRLSVDTTTGRVRGTGLLSGLFR
jgi:ABC-type lipoprotein export system ATPase subunit